MVQTTVPAILGGIVKGLKGGKASPADLTKISTSNFGHLEDIFFKPPLLDSPLTVVVEDNKEMELDIGFLAKIPLHFSLFFCIFIFIV